MMLTAIIVLALAGQSGASRVAVTPPPRLAEALTIRSGVGDDRERRRGGKSPH